MLQNTIGISIGTRTAGIVIVRGGHLIDWQVKSFKGKMNEQKLHMISGAIMKLLKEYDIKEVAMKIPHKAQSHTNVALLKKHLLKTIGSHNIPIHCYSLCDLKSSLHVSVSNKQELLEWGVGRFKELRFVYAKELKNKNSGYYIKIFEATAAVYIHIHGK